MQHLFLVTCDCAGPVTVTTVRDRITAAIQRQKANAGLSADDDEGGVTGVRVSHLPPEPGVHLTAEDYALLETLADWAQSAGPASTGANIRTVLDGDPAWIDRSITPALESLGRLWKMAMTAQNPYDPMAIVRDPEGDVGNDLALVGVSAWVKLHGGETLYICDSQQGLEVEYREANQEATDPPARSLVVPCVKQVEVDPDEVIFARYDNLPLDGISLAELLLMKAAGKGMFARVENSGSEGIYIEVAIWNGRTQRLERFCFIKLLGGEFETGGDHSPDEVARAIAKIIGLADEDDPIIHRMPSYKPPLEIKDDQVYFVRSDASAGLITLSDIKEMQGQGLQIFALAESMSSVGVDVNVAIYRCQRGVAVGGWARLCSLNLRGGEFNTGNTPRGEVAQAIAEMIGLPGPHRSAIALMPTYQPE